MKETCHIHTHSLQGAFQTSAVLPRRAVILVQRERSLRQAGKVCAWALSLNGLAFIPTQLCSATGKKTLTPFPPPLVRHSCAPPQRHREGAVLSKHWDLEICPGFEQVA